MKCAHCSRELQIGALFCPHCGTKVLENNALPSSSRIPGKKAMGTQAKLVYSVIAIVLLVGMGIAFMQNLPGGSHPVIALQPTVSQTESSEGTRYIMTPIQARVDGDFIVISMADVVMNKMVGFVYEGRTKKVELMAYINPQGKLVTSVAMCEPCNSKSFHSESQDLVCDNCGTRWNFTTLEGISGSCQKYPPDPIPSEIIGTEIRISKKIVEGWKLRI